MDKLKMAELMEKGKELNAKFNQYLESKSTKQKQYLVLGILLFLLFIFFLRYHTMSPFHDVVILGMGEYLPLKNQELFII